MRVANKAVPSTSVLLGSISCLTSLTLPRFEGHLDFFQFRGTAMNPNSYWVLLVLGRPRSWHNEWHVEIHVLVLLPTERARCFDEPVVDPIPYGVDTRPNSN